MVFVCRLSKMVHLAPVRDKVTGKQAAQLFLDSVFRYHGLPETIVSDRDPRFTVCTQQCGTRINGVYHVLLEWVKTPPGAANLAGRHCGLHRKWERGSESLFLPGLRN
ncbi:Pol protein [Phytophthora palmivora]|uniref:Pol protein n=1 Tax=Phytophthora palmivora TaxID=4796 RepID=A0A2P4XH71_9STRA|nr:Pol protein [Phytophthora palmivora]